MGESGARKGQLADRLALRGPVLRGPVLRGPVLRGPVLRGARRGWRSLAAVAAAAVLSACGSQVATSTGATQPASSARTAPAASTPAAPSEQPLSPTVTPVVLPTGTALVCSAPSAVDRLVITRVSVLPQRLHEAFPAIINVTKPAQAQVLAQAVCALPPMPSGLVNCPNDVGISYRLHFAAGGRGFAVVAVQTSGCTIVTGAGGTRTVMRSPGFWTILGQDVGLAHPTSAAAGLNGS